MAAWTNERQKGGFKFPFGQKKVPLFPLYEVIGVLSDRNTIQTSPTFSLGAVIGGLHNYDRSLVAVAKSPVLSTTGKFYLPT